MPLVSSFFPGYFFSLDPFFWLDHVGSTCFFSTKGNASGPGPGAATEGWRRSGGTRWGCIDFLTMLME